MCNLKHIIMDLRVHLHLKWGTFLQIIQYKLAIIEL